MKLIVGTLAALMAPVHAADWYVATGANCALGNGSSGLPYCTVGQAIAAASPGDTIFVGPGVYNERLTLDRDLRIVGVAGATTTFVDAGGSGSVVDAGPVQVTLEGLTLRRGEALEGGGIHAVGTTLALIDCRLTDNDARDSAFWVGGQGGAIWLSGGALTLVRVRLDGNWAIPAAGTPSDGGGLYIVGASSVALTGCTLEGNLASRQGCGYLQSIGSFSCDSSLIRGNFSDFCDPTLWVNRCALGRVVNSTFSSDGASEGTKIVAAGSDLWTIEHCTFVDDGCAYPLNVVNQGLVGGSVTVSSCVFQGAWGPTGSVLTGGFNVVQPAMPGMPGWVNGVNGDRIAVGVPLLGPSAYRGGATLTRPPLAGSVCIGNGDPNSPVSTDQRGVPRLGSARDSGAFETSKGSAVALCVAASNSTGRTGGLEVTGDPSPAAQALALTAHSLPAGATCLFLASRTAQLTSMPGGSAGSLCLGASIGRFARPGEIGASGPDGVRALQIDLLDLPQPNGAVAGVVGETWYFQAWHRDSAPAGATSNFTNAAGLLLQ